MSYSYDCDDGTTHTHLPLSSLISMLIDDTHNASLSPILMYFVAENFKSSSERFVKM